MTSARFKHKQSARQDLARIKELQQDDPTLVPLLAQAVTEFGRRAAQRKAQREAVRRVLAEFLDGVEPGTYQPAGQRGQS